MRLNPVRDERGFTMIVMVGTMFLISLLTVGAFAATNSDVNLNRNDLSHRQAYEAAQAGLNDFAFHMTRDSTYYFGCDTAGPALNLYGSTAKRRTVPGTSEQYAIELIPATGSSQCSVADPTGTMLEQSGVSNGTFRIRATGYEGKAKRAIVATFKRASFLDFLYFTQRETSDPVTYPPSYQAGAYSQCSLTLLAGRNNQAIPGSGGVYCNTIVFATGEVLRGPVHTNDAFTMCGTPTFGRATTPSGNPDSIEVSTSASPGWFSAGGGCGTSSPNFVGTFKNNQATLTPPATNQSLATIAAPAYRFTGQTKIVLNGSSMTVTPNGGTATSMALPPNGVIYVSNGSCAASYQPNSTTYPATSGCGDAYVHGTLSQPLTIATEDDIVADGSIVTTGSGLLGLIPNNFARVYHPCTSNTNGPGSLSNPTIDAAIFSVNHSFIVDNYACGALLGNLTVVGAIGQDYRGPVGIVGTHGYSKNYNYDDRLLYEEPPHFLNPVQAKWSVARQTLDFGP